MRIPLYARGWDWTRIAMFVMLGAGVASGQRYTETKLTSNVAGAAANTDANLVNAWGLSRGTNTPWWVSDGGTGLSTLYNAAGVAQARVVTVPGGAPTGTVFNGSSDFELAPSQPARFLFVSEDGTVSGWNSTLADPTHAVVVAVTPGAVYRGLAMAFADGKRRLYAADFRGGKIDIFDTSFHKVGELDTQFRSIWRGPSDDDYSGLEFEGNRRPLAPFNIQNIGGSLFVTFARPDSSGQDEIAGPGNGAVAVYSPTGKAVRLFEHVDDLNAPWGLALAPGDFGPFSHHLLVGQFGSGEILAFDIQTGRFAGKMLNAQGQTLTIDGLWALSFGSGAAASGPSNTLYFTAGPNDEQNGLFGSLTAVASELVEGNGN
jgi:uncharacterized protein (TIGR03118 family)